MTLLASQDTSGNPIQTIDGSTWDPFAQRLLFTTENPSAPTYSATASYPSTVEDVSGALGRGGYEGIQNDSDGNIWIVEDIGGAIKTGTTAAKIPNSFVYRYVPAHPGDLAHGKLQVLQVLNATNNPITSSRRPPLERTRPGRAAHLRQGLLDQVGDDSRHRSRRQRAVQREHAGEGGHGTPFKRPENGVFRPGTEFGEFFFTETGDTSATSDENATAGGWGSLFKLVQSSPSADTGKLSVFFKGTQPVTGLDNINFLSKNQLGVSRTLATGCTRRATHSTRPTRSTSPPTTRTRRTSRSGGSQRDATLRRRSTRRPAASARTMETTSSPACSSRTAIPASDGLLGAKTPNFGNGSWRWFYTQQHGDNTT